MFTVLARVWAFLKTPFGFELVLGLAVGGALLTALHVSLANARAQGEARGQIEGALRVANVNARRISIELDSVRRIRQAKVDTLTRWLVRSADASAPVTAALDAGRLPTVPEIRTLVAACDTTRISCAAVKRAYDEEIARLTDQRTNDSTAIASCRSALLKPASSPAPARSMFTMTALVPTKRDGAFAVLGGLLTEIVRHNWSPLQRRVGGGK